MLSLFQSYQSKYLAFIDSFIAYIQIFVVSFLPLATDVYSEFHIFIINTSNVIKEEKMGRPCERQG